MISRKSGKSTLPNVDFAGSRLNQLYATSLHPDATNVPIFTWIDSFPTEGQLAPQMSPTRYASWNFQSVLGCGSIEFRHPPQVRAAEEAGYWICMAVCFLYHSITWNDSIDDFFARKYK
ncbi:hypothetical protein CLAIMM_14991 [Cladophialophora immunda]|nr:hypothetical protein CLAIMM_14991 [Cladophialophora immunda]